MPSTPLNFTIYRGLRFLGLRGMALDASGAPVVFGAGTTGTLQARRAPGKPLAFSLPVITGESEGELIISPVAAEDTAELPLGEYHFDLILTGSDDEPTGPHSHGIITVKQSVTQPA